MVKSYNKYELSHTFGLVCSTSSNVISDCSAKSGGPGLAVVGANEEVFIWDVKKGELQARWADSACSAQVTAICRSATDGDVYAVGYEDGTVRLWDSRTDSVVVTFNGHKSAVSTLAFDRTGVRLASGSKDTNVIIWDLVNEVGLIKLRGHKDQVVSLVWIYPESEDRPDGAIYDDSNPDAAFVISASKDALLKLWDIAAQTCIETHLSQSGGECWAMGLSPDYTVCVTAGDHSELRVWSVDIKGLADPYSDRNERSSKHFLNARGVLRRKSGDRATNIVFHPQADYFALHGHEKAVEVWRIRSGSEVEKMMTKRRKSKSKKTKGEGTAGAENGTIKEETLATVDDYFVLHTIIRPGGKASSIAWIALKAHKSLNLLVALSNNSLETYNIPVYERRKAEEVIDYTQTFALDLPGHRMDARSVALSSDDRMIATASNGSLKIWNVKTGTCLRTLECGYALCCSFLPGDRVVVAGTKSGDIEMFDIASSSLMESIEGHGAAIWSLQVHPDGRSLVTGGADKVVKFWNFEVHREKIPETDQTNARLKLVHKRTLKLSDDILSLCFSPDSRLLAVSTLDNTIKIFFTDSLKLFLNLYGHKLPVLHISISSDNKLLVSSSADKNIRLWGLDFGDCHKSLFGHTDSIMSVKFIPEPASREDAHLFVSASKDRVIKTWDGDKFQQIQKLAGHHAEIWALTVSRTGDFFVSVSHDKSIRVWRITDEPLFLEEEREKEMEEFYESTLAVSLGKEDDDDAAAFPEDADPLTTNPDPTAPSKPTTATLTAGERLLEALDLALADLQQHAEWETARASNPRAAPPARSPVLAYAGNPPAERYVLGVVQRIPASQLRDALLVVPLAAVPGLVRVAGEWVRRRWDVVLGCRVLFFLVRAFRKQIVVGRGEFRAELERVVGDVRGALGEMRELVGWNLEGVRCVEERLAEKGWRDWDGLEVGEEEGVGRKRGFIDVA